MLRTKLLKTPQFSIRTMLVATTLVAVCLVIWRERTRYLREHLFVNVVDQVTGGLLPRFQYQTSVITSETGEDEAWSQWRDHPGQSSLTLRVPEFCKLEFRARALDVAGGYRQQEQSILVLPQLTHNATLRMTEGKSFQSFLIDSTTGKPICGARVVPVDRQDDEEHANSRDVFQHQEPYFDSEFETFSDSTGKFVVRNVSTDFAIGAKKYQCKVVRFENAPEGDLEHWRKNGIALEPAVKIQGQVKCRETGEPIKDCDVVYDNKLFPAKVIFGRQFQPLSIQERNEFNLVTKTDDTGHFELFAESEIKDHRVWFSKKGWCKESLELSSCDDAINLEPWPFELAGVVVDESGDAIQEFEIKTFSNSTDVETDRFQRNDGSFRIRAHSTISYFEVHANNKAIYSKQIDSNWAENKTNERVVMSNGHEVVGTVVGKVIGPNAGPSDVQIQLERFPSPDYTHSKQYSGDAMVASTIVGPDGSFRLNHVAGGSYKLVTSYFGHVVNTRPIVVDKTTVTVGTIELPPVGKIQGKVCNEDGSDAPFHRTYITDHQREPRKWFHTNHRGEFEVENVPCGWYGIGPKPARLQMLCCFGCGWSTDGAILVEPAQTTEFSYEHLPLFDLHGLSPLAANQVDVSPSKQSTSNWLDFAKTLDTSNGSLSTIQVTSQSRARDQEAFTVHLTQGACKQELTLVYRANRSGSPNPILFRPGQLQLRCSDADVPLEKAKLEKEFIEPNTDETSDDPFSQDTSLSASALQAELYAGRTTVFLLKQNRVISEVHSIGPQEIIPFHVHDEDPNSAIIYNTRFGWSRINFKRQHGSGPNVHELTLNKGAEIQGKVKLAELPLMPKAVRMLDEQAVSLTCEIKQDGTFEFKQIWPGKWRLQMLGYDPYLGERILANREMLIEGIDSQDLEFGASNSSNFVMQSAKIDEYRD